MEGMEDEMNYSYALRVLPRFGPLALGAYCLILVRIFRDRARLRNEETNLRKHLSDGDGHETMATRRAALLGVSKRLSESRTEDGNELESKESLDARQYHPAFLEEVFCRFR
jgi:hypothetical protein